MTFVYFHRAGRTAAWLCSLACLFVALSPTLNAWRVQSQPLLFAELCTKFGLVKVPVAGDKLPDPAEQHAPECALCVPAGTWLALAGPDAIAVPAPAGRSPAPASSARQSIPRDPHAHAWARAPPSLS